jgi:hypothetical protein
MDLAELGVDLSGPDPPAATPARRQRRDRSTDLDDIDRVERGQARAPVEDRRGQSIDDAHDHVALFAPHDASSAFTRQARPVARVEHRIDEHEGAPALQG